MSKKQNSILDIDKLEYQTYDNMVLVKLIFEESIPNNWKVKKVKNNVVKPITDGPHITPKLVEEGIPFLSVNNIQNNKIVFDNKIRYVSESDANEYRKKTDIRRNDLLLVKQASIGKLSLVETDEVLSIWSPLVQFRFKDYIIPKYMKYYMESELYQNNLDLTASESTQKNIGMGDIQNLYDILPSKKEQLAIVKFLDSKTSQIDKKIELLENQNRLEEELEKSIVNQCVTKGVDSFTKKDKNGNLIDFDNTQGLSKEDFDTYMNENGYKDSGIEWIGYVPNYYNIKRVKDMVENVQSGTTPSSKDAKNKNNQIINWFTPGDLKNNILINSKRKINKYSIETNQVRLIKKPSVLLSTVGEIGKIGYSKIETTSNQQITALIPNKKVFLKYMFYILSNNKKYITIHANDTTLPQLNNNNLLNINNMVIPSKKEQLEIVKFLDSKTEKIKTSREKRSKEIELLKEYKKTLINDVVTGKIKVIKD